MPSIWTTKDTDTKISEALDHFFDPTKPAIGFRNLVEAFGLAHGLQRLEEALSSTSFAQVLGDSLTRRVVAAYHGLAQRADWRRIATIARVTDFRTQRRTRFGGYGNFPIVAQGQAYPAMTSPTDEAASYAIAKHGGTESITFEAVRNDDVGLIRRIPGAMATAAANTLREFVFDLVATNPVLYDSLALFSAPHANLLTDALAPTSLTSARNLLKAQTDMSSGKRLGLVPRYLWIPDALEPVAIQILSAARALPADPATFPTTAEPAAPNVIQSWRIEPMPVDYWSDDNNWFLSADPSQTPMIEVGFLDGQADPTVVIASDPRSGAMFSNDQITLKLQHVYGGTVLDYRGFVGSIVP